jgi:hypothetical protein
MNSKEINYYYSTLNQNGQSVFRCLRNDCDEIIEVPVLNTKKCKNYRMNDKYEAKDEDLFMFREDLNKWNDDIKQHFFKTKEKKVFKVDVFHYNTINDAIYNTLIMNSDQKTLNTLPDIDFHELRMIENCLTCGLITIDKDIIGKTIDCYGYDYSKFYFHMMKKIRIPTSKPEYYVSDEINFDKLDFGYYRVKILCSDKTFMKCFKFNSKNFYNHNTLKTVYKFKDRYNIRFELLPADETFDYNFIWYENTIELKKLFKQWFATMETLLKKCDKKNWLLKSYISQAWGTLSKYDKLYVHADDVESYDFEQLNKISGEKYDYYAHSFSNDLYAMINANHPFKYGGIARMKIFLTEYARNYVFYMINENNLQDYVLRCHTDGIAFNRPIDFTSMGLDYCPIPEEKSTGKIIFHNVNSYEKVN